ncbi:putative methylesterase 14, chloroplastic isoform X2 [Phalaenopsis equestris]|uniref:putative methylesterase 14, chloroplastic isoform X2 n=1 Tax=Phalaenopsis equestris TaxID=78828 RepID=UPI0009E3EAAB|nr:putative methylesterase 14, chloroplastic isoform X2 [Phalaenopsis equestris]
MGNKMVCMPIKEFKGTFRYRSRKEMKRSSSMKKLMSEKDKISHLSQRYESCVINRVVPTRSQPPRSLSDPLPNHKQVPIFVEKIETKKVILVHGEGLGAWCWYKIVPMMEEAGMVPVALDLAGSGTNNSIDFSRITSLEDYSKPLMNYLGSLADNEKLGPAELFLKESQNLLYGNGKEKPPTALLLEKDQIKCLYFNHCSPKDVALASMSMRAVPLVPMMEKMKLTAENYGNVRRFFIHTSDDNILRLQIQEEMVQKNPPHGVYKIKGSDHSPFFSKPRSLNKILLEIAQL